MNKKFKKIVCFLVIVITTLSVSLNAFAWTKSGHEGLMKNGVSLAGLSLTNDQLSVLTYACTFQDKSISNLSGMKDYPQFHGYFVNSSNTICSYISCYVYLTQLEVYLRTGTWPSCTPCVLPSADYYAISEVVTAEGINNIKWDDIFKDIPNSNGQTNTIKVTNDLKRLFITGMALHIATDVFAHSAWEPDSTGTSWTRIKHVTDSNNMYAADDPKYVPSRYTAAQQVAKNVMGHYKNSTVGTVFDFILSEQYYNGTFLLGNFKESAWKANDYEFTSDMTKVYHTIDLQLKCQDNGWSYLFE